MRTLIAVSLLSLAACTTAGGDSAPNAVPALGTADELSGAHVAHCDQAPEAIAAAFAAFDAATSPPALGQPALVVLGEWLGHLDPAVVFEAGNAPPLVGRAAVASYFDPLLPVIGSTVHDLDTVSPVCGANAWSVRGTLLLTRRSDGRAITPIPFTDTLFFDEQGSTIVRYEIRFDPSPIGELFAP